MVTPFTVSAHHSFSVTGVFFGTVIVNMPKPRFGRKCVGWPRSTSPGSKRLLGPIGTSISVRPVAVVVADQERVRAVGVVVPAFEGRRDAGAECPLRRARQQLAVADTVEIAGTSGRRSSQSGTDLVCSHDGCLPHCRGSVGGGRLMRRRATAGTRRRSGRRRSSRHAPFHRPCDRRSPPIDRDRGSILFALVLS